MTTQVSDPRCCGNETCRALDISLGMLQKLCTALDLQTPDGLQFRSVMIVGSDHLVPLLDFARTYESNPGTVDALLAVEPGRPVEATICGLRATLIQVFDDSRVINMASAEDPWIACPCGNNPECCGFTHCDSNGNDKTDGDGGPSDDWDGKHFKCMICRRIFDNGTKKIVGTADEIIEE